MTMLCFISDINILWQSLRVGEVLELKTKLELQ